MTDFFDFLEAKTKQKEEEPELREKALIDALRKAAEAFGKHSTNQADIADTIANALRHMKPPQVTVTPAKVTITNPPAAVDQPVSYRFTIHRNNNRNIDYIDAEVIKTS